MSDIKLPVQLYVTRKRSRPAADGFVPVQNSSHFVKPKGGMWTSSWNAAERRSAWIAWCQEAGQGRWIQDKPWWLLTPEQDCRIARIHSLADLKRLLQRYPYHHPIMDRLPFMIGQYLDYEAMTADYDAIHLTERGQERTRLTTPNLYGWDCECTLWLRWKFASVKPASQQQGGEAVDDQATG